MMIRNKNIGFLRSVLFFISWFLAFACTNQKSLEEQAQHDVALFEKVVTDVTEAYVMPSSVVFLKDMRALNVAVDKLISLRNEDALNTVKLAWVETYFTWQMISLLDFGPAEELMLADLVGKFPVDPSAVVPDENNRLLAEEKGLMAVEYMIFSATTEETLQEVRNSETFRQALLRKVAEMNELSTQYQLKWQSYQSNFANQTGVEEDQSVSQLVSAAIKTISLMNGKKLGRPMGIDGGEVDFELIEGTYSGESMSALRLQWAFWKGLWKGEINVKDYEMVFSGLGEILGEGEQHQQLVEKMAEVDALFAQVNLKDMRKAITYFPEEMQALQTALEEMEVLTLSLPSSMGIAVN